MRPESQKDKVGGELAVERGYVSPEQLAEAVGGQRLLRDRGRAQGR